MRQNYSFSKNSNALLEPCEGKLSCTVLRGKAPAMGLTYSTPNWCMPSARWSDLSAASRFTQVVERRPRHQQDRRVVVRCLHLPYRCRHHSPFILPLMSEYQINKGIGRSVEYKGLKAQYLFIFAGGLLAMFVVFVIMYIVGISQMVLHRLRCHRHINLVWLTFHLNAKYGEHGLMKLSASKYHPRYIINRLRITRLIKGRK